MIDRSDELEYIKNNYREEDEIHMIDRAGHRWCRCIHCGELKPTDEMLIYGGSGRSMNTGECRMCLWYLGFIENPQQ